MSVKKKTGDVGFGLFYGSLPMANVLILSERNDNGDDFLYSSPPNPFNSLEWQNFRSSVFKPLVDLRLILERQRIVTLIRSLESDFRRSLINQKFSAYGLAAINFLLDVDYREKRKQEEAPYSQPYTPKNRLEELLAFGFDVNQLTTLTKDDSEDQDSEYGFYLDQIVNSLKAFDDGLNQLHVFVEMLKQLDDRHFPAMAKSIERYISKLPEVSAVILVDLLKSKKNEKLVRLQKKINQLMQLVSQVGTIISLAQWSISDGLSLVSFDDSKPQGYLQGWSLAVPKASWGSQQVLNDSAIDTPIVILSGSNMSGKTFSLKQRMLISMCAQAYGYAPASEINLRILDNFVYLDRASTASAHNLSAFGEEASQWRLVLESCHSASNSAIFADESFSTTSAEDQYRLLVGVIEYLVNQQAQIFLACHNPDVHEYFAKDHRASIYHFETGVAENGDIKFLYRMIPGIGDSQALDVAKRLALPSQVLVAAQSFITGGREKISVKPRFKRIRRYTDKQRAKMKSGSRSLMDFHFEANEIQIIKTKTGKKLKRRYGRKDHYYHGDPDCEEWPKKEPFFLTLSEDWDVRFNPHVGKGYSNIAGSILRDSASSDVAEILERQLMFQELAKINEEEFEIIRMELIRFLIGVNVLREPDKEDRYQWSVGNKLITGNFGIEMIDHLLNYYQSHTYFHDNESMFNLVMATIEFNLKLSGLEADTVIATNLELLHQLEQLEKEDTKFRRLFYRAESPEEQEEFIRQGAEIQKQMLAIQQGKSRDNFIKETLISLLESIKSRLTPIRLIDCDYSKLVELVAPVKVAYDRAEENFMFDTAPGYFNSLWALTDVHNPISDFLGLLRQADSVHLHQFANYLSDIFQVYTDGNGTGPQLISYILEQAEINKDADPEDYWRRPHSRHDFSYEWVRMIREQVEVICALVELAQQLADRNEFCPVKFNSTGEIIMEQGWSLGDRNKKREDQVRNSSHFHRGQLVNLSSGANMSGKTYDLKKEAWAIVCAQSTGFAPASSLSMPVFGRVIYIDRVNVKLNADLSAFGTEVEFWKSLFSSLGDSGPAFIAIDEAFSTSSPKYQSALTYGAVWALAENGELVSIASHNHDFILDFNNANSEFSSISHFLTHVGEDGKIEFDYRKQPGHALSDGIEVARKLGLPMEIIETAKAVV